MMIFASTTKIRVGGREFESIEELYESGYPKGKVTEFVGTEWICWWADATVMFPDKYACSACFVEVQNKRVLIGKPNNYVWYILPTVKQALQFAQTVNQAWLSYPNSPDKFIREELSKLEAELP